MKNVLVLTCAVLLGSLGVGCDPEDDASADAALDGGPGDGAVERDAAAPHDSGMDDARDAAAVDAAADAGGGDGSNADAEVDAQVPVPPSVTDGGVTVSCTASCDGDEDCAQATVFVSACDSDTPDLCYDIDLAETPDGDGNTYLVSIDQQGVQDVLEQAQCTSTSDEDDALPVDLLFVIDTTSSMAAAIDGVKASVNAFIDDLAADHVDARIGGIAFGNTAPIMSCDAPDAPYAPFTDTFGEGTESDEASFNFWVDNLSHTHCGDVGGSDIPENGLDALGYALGEPFLPEDPAPTTFDWNADSLHVVVFITDAVQHQAGFPGTLSHFLLSDLEAQLQGSAVVHVVGPNHGCHNTPAAQCACNTTPNVCDEDCACDFSCPLADCADDLIVNVCDTAGSVCDLDCAGYTGSACDVTVGLCDSDPSTSEACETDVDCSQGQSVGAYGTRRCEPRDQSPYADVGELAFATNGTFTTLPPDGHVDLTTLPLGGVLAKTESCSTALPSDATSVRCVYIDQDGNEGEVTVRLQTAPEQP